MSLKARPPKFPKPPMRPPVPEDRRVARVNQARPTAVQMQRFQALFEDTDWKLSLSFSPDRKGGWIFTLENPCLVRSSRPTLALLAVADRLEDEVMADEADVECGIWLAIAEGCLMVSGGEPSTPTITSMKRADNPDKPHLAYCAGVRIPSPPGKSWASQGEVIDYLFECSGLEEGDLKPLPVPYDPDAPDDK